MPTQTNTISFGIDTGTTSLNNDALIITGNTYNNLYVSNI